MNKLSLSQLITDESMPVDVEWVQRLMLEHPTCVLPAALMLRRNAFLLDDERATDLAATVMLASADPAAMADLANLARADWHHFYPVHTQTAPDTVDTIDTFLERYGKVTPAENALLERMIFNPVPPDYFSDADTETAALPHDNWSDLMPVSSVAAEPDTEPAEPTGVTEPDKATPDPQHVTPPHTEPLLRLSLAKIFIKQHRYERAFEIIHNLCLNNPEKSAYFADQLRFLRKLINNQRYIKSQS